MKKIFITIICILAAYVTVLIDFSTSKSSEKNEALKTILKEPPTLTIICSEESVDATKTTTSWHYQNPDGTFTGINADSQHPLDLKETMTDLIIRPTPYSSISPLTAYLNWKTAPDKVSVRSWSDEHWGNTDAQSENVNVVVTSDGLTFINLKKDNCIYEVIAEWSASKKYGGTVHYCFYTQNSLIFNFDINELKPLN